MNDLSAPWRTLRGFLTDPSLWRDVTKGVLTFVITGAIAFTFAVVAGYLRSPSGQAILVLFLGLTAMFLVAFAISWRAEKLAGAAKVTFLFVVFVAILMIVAAIGYGILTAAGPDRGNGVALVLPAAAAHVVESH